MDKKYVTRFMLLLFFMVMVAFAVTGSFSVRAEYAHYGGINTYDDFEAKTTADAKQLEYTLKEDGYILLSKDSTDITQEELDDFLENDFSSELWFTGYIDASEDYKVYVLKDLFYQFFEDIENPETYHCMTDETMLDFYDTSVIIDYTIIKALEQEGTYSDQWGDNLSADANVGYLKISTPIYVKIELYNIHSHVYHIIPFDEGETPVRVKTGDYRITKINSIEVSENEPLLPYANNITIKESNTEEKPYMIELTDFLRKYSSDGFGNIIEETDVRYEPGSFAVTEPVETQTEQQSPKLPFNLNIGLLIILLMIAVAIFIWLSSYVTEKINQRYGNDDE